MWWICVVVARPSTMSVHSWSLRLSLCSNWHDHARFSPVDGSPTVPVKAGWAQLNRFGGHEEFPRIDPAIICPLHDGGIVACWRGRRCQWPERLFSLIAGFVEAGSRSRRASPARWPRRSVWTFATSSIWAVSRAVPSSLMVGSMRSVIRIRSSFQRWRDRSGQWFTRAEVREALEHGDWSKTRSPGCCFQVDLDRPRDHRVLGGAQRPDRQTGANVRVDVSSEFDAGLDLRPQLLMSATLGLVSAEPSANLTVGTVWLPPLTPRTKAAAACRARCRLRPGEGDAGGLHAGLQPSAVAAPDSAVHGDLSVFEAIGVPTYRRREGGVRPVAAPCQDGGHAGAFRSLAALTMNSARRCWLPRPDVRAGGCRHQEDRTITHRIAHLVSNGHVAAGQVLAVTFTARLLPVRCAAGLRAMVSRQRRRGRDGAGAHVSRRRARQRYFWSPAWSVAAIRWELLDSLSARRDGLRTDAACQYRRCPAIRGRDRMGQGVADQSGVLPGGGREGQSRHSARRGEGLGRLRTTKAEGRPMTASRLDFDDLLLHTAGPSRTISPSRASSAIVTAASSSTSTRTSPRCSSVCSAHGWGARRSDGRRRRQPDHLSVHRSHAALPARLLAEFPRRPWSVWNGLPVDATGGTAGESSDAAAHRREPVALIGQRLPGPAPRFRDYPDEVAEAKGCRDVDQRTLSTPGPQPPR